MKEESHDNISEDHLCSICLEILYKPIRIISCEHVFCQDCLYDSSKTARRRSCPLCRRQFAQEEVQPALQLWNYLNSRYPQSIQARKKHKNQKFEVRYVVGNMAERAEQIQGRDFYRWNFYIREIPGSAKLSQYVEQIDVKLHPTFEPRVVSFQVGIGEEVEISRIGWGTFGIEATIYWKDLFKERRTVINHQLSWDPITQRRLMTTLCVK